jgi:hypothetical protein
VQQDAGRAEEEAEAEQVCARGRAPALEGGFARRQEWAIAPR